MFIDLSTRPWLSGRMIDGLHMQLPDWCAQSTVLRTRLLMQGIDLNTKFADIDSIKEVIEEAEEA
jgi:hypothetical protein